MSNIYLDPSSEWGMMILCESSHFGLTSCPEWADRLQRNEWGSHGFTIWDNPTHTIARIPAGQVLAWLTQMAQDMKWHQSGITVGEPATRIALDRPDQEPQVVLHNQIHLDPIRSEVFLNFCQQYREELTRLVEDDQKALDKAMVEVIKIFAARGRKIRNQNGQE
jgi:hypothetical protein